MDRFLRESAPKPVPRPETRATPGRAVPRGISREVFAVAAAAAALAGVSWACGYPATPSLLGLGVLIAAKGAAIFGFDASRPRSEEDMPGAMAEALTLGCLVAFVVSLAVGRSAPLPRAYVLMDWVTGLAVLSLMRPAGGRRAAPARFRRDAIDPATTAALRGISILIAGTKRREQPLLDAFWEHSPERVLCRAADSRGEARKILAAESPRIVLLVASAEQDESGVALQTRWLLNAVLATRADAFVLVAPEGHHGLSGLIVAALKGLTRTRLIRVIVSAGASDVPRRIARISARGQDGAVFRLGLRGDAEVEVVPPLVEVQALWDEMDRLEAAQAVTV